MGLAEAAIVITDLAEVIGTAIGLNLAFGILGATVMPHNLYLHSAVIQTRAFGPSRAEKMDAIRLGTVDSTLALLIALFINGAILVLAATTLHRSGQTGVAEIQDAYKLIGTTLGAPLATTLSGQIVMEGFVQMRLKPWIRRLVTRGIAIVPAAVVTVMYGESGTAELLVLSQVVLSLQLPFAIVPLVVFTADNRRMNGLRAPRWLTAAAWLIAALIIALNLKLSGT